MHSITPAQYLEQFPEAPIFSKEVLESDNFGGRSMKGKNAKPFTEEHKRKIGEARSNYTGWSHSEETIEKMRQTSQRPDVMEARRQAALQLNSDPAHRKMLSDKAKAHIAEHGLHLKRGKVTRCEQAIIDVLEENDIEYKREQRSSKRIENAYRFFDFIVPSLNLIIEVDGEFWHRQEDRVKIDELKMQDALSSGYSFLRLSDKLDYDILANPRMLLDLIQADATVHEIHTSHVISQRMQYIATHGYTKGKSNHATRTPDELKQVLSAASKAAWAKKIADGYSMPDEQRKKLSEARKGKKFGPRKKQIQAQIEPVSELLTF
jgi:very-short-patch-repair endonuclease